MSTPRKPTPVQRKTARKPSEGLLSGFLSVKTVGGVPPMSAEEEASLRRQGIIKDPTSETLVGAGGGSGPRRKFIPAQKQDYGEFGNYAAEYDVMNRALLEMGSDFADHPLLGVLIDVLGQACYGKGERHGGVGAPFLEQGWVHYARLHGRGFLTGQAAKKLEEAASLWAGSQFIDEVLGAMVYAGMSVIKERGEV